ncbi:hypothetical protein JGH11_09860 [Dysgonomonas sp. Marseille-P4677]|uniref:hypothetical protein n=1 Tax=Dysgonomonas sp. Marseille-P4677 TaxID=2364790 RepID=UPI001912C7A7|nr:hypothetical protein [Dysgonomonas sp. Marseille-P4677]MBK5721173.1 hypothetical protein [Dysgonomonas sp. Marseille-P4677]
MPAQESSFIKNFDSLDSYAELKLVYGWMYNSKSDKWIIKENRIANIDYYSNYYIVSLHNQSNKYICIIKQFEEKGAISFESYILDYNDYISKISLWEEHTILKFPILKKNKIKLKKGTQLSKELLGIDNLSDVLSNPRDYFVFQYRFEKDSTVKFLFYQESCFVNDCQPSSLNCEEKYLSYYVHVGNDNLYSNFFYKTMLKYFTQFIDSPITK